MIEKNRADAPTRRLRTRDSSGSCHSLSLGGRVSVRVCQLGLSTKNLVSADLLFIGGFRSVEEREPSITCDHPIYISESLRNVSRESRGGSNFDPMLSKRPHNSEIETTAKHTRRVYLFRAPHPQFES